MNYGKIEIVNNNQNQNPLILFDFTRVRVNYWTDY